MSSSDISRQGGGCPVFVQAHAAVTARPGTLEEILAAVRSGQRFEPGRERLVVSEDLAARARLPPRESKKVDRFSLLSLAAVHQAFEACPLDPADLERCGMVVGNMLAGWSFTEPQIRMLHTRGPAAVSPYLATAWFPAAAQGHTTITLGMHGFAKTVTTDRCSGGQAIGMAFHRLRQGEPGPLLAGGVEAPVTPLVEAALGNEAQPASRLAEAAGFLLLKGGTPPTPGARVLGAHASFRLTTPERTEERLARFLERVDRSRPLAAVVCNAQPWSEAERALHALLRRRLGDDVPRLDPCRTLGDSLGASSGLAAALACELLAQPPFSRSVLVVSLGHQCADFLWIHS